MINVKYWRIFCDVISLLAQVFIVSFDRAYKEVSKKKILKISLKSTNFDIFRDVISLLAQIFILLIDTATQEVPMKNIWKKLSVQFLRYAIELLHVKRRTRHKWR